MPMHPTISKRKPYSPYFNPNQFSPALWLDASDQSTLVTDGAASFASASSQYLSCTSNSTLQTGDVSYWLGFWVKSIVGGNQHFASKGASGAAGYEWKVQTQSNNTFRFQALSSNAASADSVTSGTATFTNWNFLLCYKDVGGNVGIILNGNNPVTTAQTITQVAGTAALELGKYLTGYFDGQLDSVVFGKPSNGWLAANAVSLASYLYNSGNGRRSSDFINSSYYTGGNPSGAISWWDLDEASGTRKDRIGTNDLTDNNSVGYASGIASGLVQYDGDPVKQWNDKSKNGRNLVAPSDATRPIYKVNQQNGNSAILFDGIDDLVQLTNASAFTTLDNITVFGVIKPTAAAAADTMTGGFLIYLYDSVGATNFWIAAGSVNSAVLSNDTVVVAGFLSSTNGDFRLGASSTNYTRSANTTQIWCSLLGTNGTSFYVNGSQIILDLTNAGNAQTPSGPSQTTIPSPVLGHPNDNFYGGKGEQRTMELIVYPFILSTSQRRKVERYLANKWGITLS